MIMEASGEVYSSFIKSRVDHKQPGEKRFKRMSVAFGTDRRQTGVVATMA